MCLIKIYQGELSWLEWSFKITGSIASLYLGNKIMKRHRNHDEDGRNGYYNFHDDDCCQRFSSWDVCNSLCAALLNFGLWKLLAGVVIYLLVCRFAWDKNLPEVKQGWAKWVGRLERELQGRRWHKMRRPMPSTWRDPPSWTLPSRVLSLWWTSPWRTLYSSSKYPIPIMKNRLLSNPWILQWRVEMVNNWDKRQSQHILFHPLQYLILLIRTALDVNSV